MLAIPLACAFVFAFGSLFLKRSLELDADPLQVAFLTNIAISVPMMFYLITGPVLTEDARFWQPIVVSLTFTSGVLMSFLALNKGDASVANPLLGLKTIFAAVLYLLLFNRRVSVGLWIGAVLVFFALILLRGHNTRTKASYLPTVFFSLFAAGLFSTTDILIREWSPYWNRLFFLGLSYSAVFVLTLLFIPFFKQPLFSLSGATKRMLLSGAGVQGLQALAYLTSLSLIPGTNAVEMNVMYSTRGLWTVLVVWFIGRWYGAEERSDIGPVIWKRIGGAVLMFAAVVLTLYLRR